MTTIRKKLSGGFLQSIGAAQDIAEEVLDHPALFDELFECLLDEDRTVRARTAYTLIQIAPARPDLFQPYKELLLTEVAPIEQWEVREQFCKIIVLLKLSKRDIAQTFGIFVSYLDDRSSIVRSCALQGLHDLAFLDPALKPEVIDLIEEKVSHGTAAMRARGKRLLKQLYGPANY